MKFNKTLISVALALTTTALYAKDEPPPSFWEPVAEGLCAWRVEPGGPESLECSSPSISLLIEWLNTFSDAQKVSVANEEKCAGVMDGLHIMIAPINSTRTAIHSAVEALNRVTEGRLSALETADAVVFSCETPSEVRRIPTNDTAGAQK